MTKAQMKALEWLAADGSWRTNAGRLAAAISSLSLGKVGVVEHRYGQFGPRGGWVTGYRLTPLGQELRRVHFGGTP